MTGRVVEIAEDGRHLSLSRGFLVVSAEGREIGRVPLDDIAVVMANAHGLTYSNNLLVALCERGAVMVLCGSNHVPAAFLWPVDSHHVQARRMRAQVEAPAPLAKRLWQACVRAKIRQQAAALDSRGLPGGGLLEMARRVRSGDPDNLEAQAARRYWPALFGAEFRRDQDAGGANAMLNYGYAILRSATARAVTAAGLHPSIGLHHSNRGNPLCLVDDLMEPFRPLIDLAVLRLLEAGHTGVTREVKRFLALVPSLDMLTAQGTTPIGTVLIRLAGSLARVLEEGKGDLDLPALDRPWAPMPLEWPPPAPDDRAC
ncbi:type II CRISPR-associated endonuclease Cas1 [Azospirillum sp. RWY-5-1]|uniref:CRISPR-associated endonuclease Cas1 n=1 Tax=Azospirillum oleiclasticum TaxID=2735135 RepID=A0ABX2T9D8_9PROT|nr:type II CRISPR-associated endonuclease Cas1 [Azospirillum oleiclasticum]NYZ13638.1 type II CRISPR-associated endonuclease Cas1 [Azospirillum oleiclasticum]NYZ20910.1 type II CRISPR-associated endonuclease Cas1 [Azospirillum oleiclasticum]